jgi:transcriptional regulator with XRE-family HTH domain
MSLEKEVKQLFKHFRDAQFGGKNSLAAEFLGVTEPTFSRWVNGVHIPKIETLIIPFERLNARIVIGDSAENEALERKCRELESKLKDLQELLEAKNEVIRLQAELIATLKNEEPEEKGVDTERLPLSDVHGTRIET